MATKDLSPRENEILDHCIQGLTNDAIAYKLGLSIGTVNTYWLRIRIKAGGIGRTDTVARIIKVRAERALQDATVQRSDLHRIVIEKEHQLMDLRATLALLNLALDQIQSTVWATDTEFRIQVIASGATATPQFGISGEVGRTIQEVLNSEDPTNPIIAAHVNALAGRETSIRLPSPLEGIHIRVLPLKDEHHSEAVVGCVCILNGVGSKLPTGW